MPLNLYVKRAKSFLLNTEDGERALTLYAGNTGPQPAPDWIKQTLTFKLGVKDGSIIDLTAGHGRGRKNVAEVSPYDAAPQAIGKNAVAVLDEPSPVAKPAETPIAHKPFGNPQPTPVKGLQPATTTATHAVRRRSATPRVPISITGPRTPHSRSGPMEFTTRPATTSIGATPTSSGIRQPGSGGW